jgi:hypothetical protein
MPLTQRLARITQSILETYEGPKATGAHVRFTPKADIG